MFVFSLISWVIRDLFFYDDVFTKHKANTSRRCSIAKFLILKMSLVMHAVLI